MHIINKVVFNMVILYAKILITMFISLYSVPLILNALGASDFGLYNLIAGIIIMLAFLNTSMAVSTQRYMSVSMGEKDTLKIKLVFNASIILHFIIGFLIVLILEFGSFFLFNGFLNIPPERLNAAKIIYQFLVTSTFFAIISVPFDAAINAHEDMLAFSILDIIESICKLLVAYFLSKIFFDKLIFYGASLTLITISVMLIKGLFCKKKYPYCKLNLKIIIDWILLKKMFSFIGWNTFGALAMLGRNQGIAVILNLFFGTVVNASYGVANQINGVLSNFSITLQKSINPQLMKSEGENNRTRMLKIAFISSKFSVIVFSLFAIPLIIEMPYILKVWLKQVPENTILFCRLILTLTIIVQYSSGLMSAIQSVGKIKNYTIVMNILLLLNLPISIFMLKLNYPAYSVLICAIIIEVFTLYARLLFANKLTNLSKTLFFKNVILKSLLPIIISFTLCFYLSTIINNGLFNVIAVMFCNILIFFFFIKYMTLSKEENEKIKNIYFQIKNFAQLEIKKYYELCQNKIFYKHLG